MPNHDLQGLNILVTRPQAQSAWLSTEIRLRGGNPLVLPLLAIQPLTPSQTQPTLAQLEQVALLIFISANAVEFGLAYLPALPASLQVGAIGQATAERLRTAGIRTDLVPARFDSEGFLALPQVQDLRDKTVLIVRGAGGREKLAEALRVRGAQVRYLEVYRRDCPRWQTEDVRTALHADVITVTSSEALENLAQLAKLPGGAGLLAKPLVVFHDRIAGRARELGFTLKPVVTTQPSDEALLMALLRWANEQEGMEHA
jgi:uroporphyrinogen-III synthase